MIPRKYFILDVFAYLPFQGNPLAVVLAARGLDPDQMQMIANEFNSAVTAFVTESLEENGVDFKVKLFTPDRAIAFASQPTIGVAILLAMIDDREKQIPRTFRLHEDLGIVECTVDELRTEGGRARFLFPQIPR
ncbi:MAG: PhzF family phenazine biosynthesis protein, partial [Opitutaceae bacterium]|nr:PhzF family phenazine biosynthesis protein [Opitutaceae bacterium]